MCQTLYTIFMSIVSYNPQTTSFVKFYHYPHHIWAGCLLGLISMEVYFCSMEPGRETASTQGNLSLRHRERRSWWNYVMVVNAFKWHLPLSLTCHWPKQNTHPRLKTVNRKVKFSPIIELQIFWAIMTCVYPMRNLRHWVGKGFAHGHRVRFWLIF